MNNTPQLSIRTSHTELTGAEPTPLIDSKLKFGVSEDEISRIDSIIRKIVKNEDTVQDIWVKIFDFNIELGELDVIKTLAKKINSMNNSRTIGRQRRECSLFTPIGNNYRSYDGDDAPRTLLDIIASPPIEPFVDSDEDELATRIFKYEGEETICKDCAALASPGHVSCDYHLQYKRNYNIANKDRESECARQKYYLRKNNGLCVDCGYLVFPGTTKCIYHLLLARAQSRQSYYKHHLPIIGKPRKQKKGMAKVIYWRRKNQKQCVNCSKLATHGVFCQYHQEYRSAWKKNHPQLSRVVCKLCKSCGAAMVMYTTYKGHRHRRCLQCDLRPIRSKLLGIKCKFCGNDYVVRFGTDKGRKRYLCRKCERTFTNNKALERMRYPIEIVSAAIMMASNNHHSTSSVARQINEMYNLKISVSTVCHWVKNYHFNNGIIVKNGKVIDD